MCESFDGVVESAAVRLVVTLVLGEVGGHDDGVEPSLAHEWQVDAATLLTPEVKGVEEHRRVGVRVEGDHGVVQASGVGVPACTADKMAEKIEHRLMASGGEPFGVPLDAEDGVFGVLHRFVDAIGRLGRGDETGGQVADGLVVERVDGDGCGTRRGVEPHCALQLGIWGSESDRLRDDVACFRLTMWQYGAWKLRGKVLVERAAKGYVDELMAATDAEDGEAALVGQADQLQLAGVADRIDVLERRVRSLAKQVGTDVAAASQE